MNYNYLNGEIYHEEQETLGQSLLAFLLFLGIVAVGLAVIIIN